MELSYDRFNFQVDKKLLESCLFVCVSGSHSFGWATPKSDLDVRFVILPDVAQLISPFYQMRTNHYINEEIDVTEYPITRYLSLLADGNGNAVDNLFEPKLHERKDQVISLQDIIASHIHQGFLWHCLGYSAHIEKDFHVDSRINSYGEAKLLLTRYRILLQGFNLLNNKIEYNLRKLGEVYSSLAIQLLDAYLTGSKVDSEMIDACKSDTHNLEVRLGAEVIKSSIPEKNSSGITSALDKWMRDLYIKKPYGAKW